MQATQAHFEQRDKRKCRNSLVSIREGCAQQCGLMKLVAQLVLALVNYGTA